MMNSMATTTTDAQKIPIPAMTSPGSVGRAAGGGMSGTKIFFDLMKASVMVACQSSINATLSTPNTQKRSSGLE